MDLNQRRYLSSWLNILAILVIIMVSIGGITRLTGSGLSMVTWKPVTGIIPPISQKAWNDEFELYKSSPEFKLVNNHFTLSEFKKIYFWEYLHRVFGRFIGLVFFVPYMFFLFKKMIPRDKSFKIFIAFILGGSQGLLGWYMVKSGLVNIPEVSHYRLAAHLLLAFFIIFYLRLLSVDIDKNMQKIKRKSSLISLILIGLIFMQIMYGAFVAGLDAGLSFNTFPKMAGRWIPENLFILLPAWINFFENPILVQFIHRSLGSLILIFCVYLAVKSSSVFTTFIQKKYFKLLFSLILLQFVLGVLTLIYKVPFSLAIIHQFIASLIVYTGAKFFYLCGRE